MGVKDYKFLDVNEYREVFVVGDIHGCYSLLMTKLKQVGFNVNTDLLISVGDLVDRGTENEKVFNLLNQHWFTAIKGNHEDFCYKGLYDSTVEFYHKMSNNGGKWFYELPDDIREHVGRKMNSLPTLLEVDFKGKRFGFVHADVPVEDWSLLVEMVINEDNDLNMDRNIVESCLWGRKVVYLDTYNVADIKRVFLGHTVLPRIKDVGNCTFLDTGGVFKQEGQPYDLSIVKLSDYI